MELQKGGSVIVWIPWETGDRECTGLTIPSESGVGDLKRAGPIVYGGHPMRTEFMI